MNGLPVIAAPAVATVALAVATAIPSVSLSETGATAGETFTATVSDTAGLLTATGAGVTDSGTTSLAVTGSLAQVNADLATLTDTEGGTAADTITLNATDSFGNAAVSDTIAVSVSGHPVPVITAPATFRLGLEVNSALAGLSLSETGAVAGGTFTETLADTSGVLTASGTGVSGSGTTALSITGTLARVNAALATLHDSDNNFMTDLLTLNATDSLGGIAAQRTVLVNVNGTPTLTTPVSAVLGVARPGAISGVSLAENGTTSGESFTVTLVDTAGLLSASGVGVSGAGTSSLTVTGSLVQVNAALATLADIDAATGSDTIIVNATDSLGGTATPASVAVTVNSLPTLAAPAAATVAQTVATAVPGVNLSEAGTTAGETFTVTLSDGAGLLSAIGATGVGTTSVSVTGTLAQVNAALATLQDTDASALAHSIVVSATDGFGNAAAAKSIAVTVSAHAVSVFAVPTALTAPTALTVGDGVSTAVVGVSLSETNAPVGEIFTATVADTNGLLAATGTGVTGSGTTTLTLSGSLAEVNAALATLRDTDATTPSDTLLLTAVDSLGGHATAATVAVTVNGLPVIAVPSAATLGFGITTAIGGVSLSESGNTTGETFTATLTDANGLLAASGAGVTGSGTTTLGVTGTLAQVNADLGTLTDTDGLDGERHDRRPGQRQPGCRRSKPGNLDCREPRHPGARERRQHGVLFAGRAANHRRSGCDRQRAWHRDPGIASLASRA